MGRDHTYKARLHLSASRLTALEWPIFEAKENKAPATKRGFKDARVDSGQVSRWSDTAMIAHATGKAGGTVVIDLDIDNAKGVNGLEWLAQLQNQHGALPPHPISTTPRGGQHHYFQYPANRVVRSSAGKLAPGIDVRAEGGYVIVPDSESNRGAYSWNVAPWDVAPPELPAWLLERVANPHPGVFTDDTLPTTEADKEEIERETQEVLNALRASKAGGRNHALNTAAYLLGKMIGAGVADEAVVEFQLLNIAAEIGLTNAEAKATIRSGLSAGKKRPWRPSFGYRDLQRLNRDYFFCIDGKTAFVFREHRDPISGNRALSRYYPAAFRELHGNKSALRVLPDGNVKPAKLGDAWLSWPGRREYSHVTFAPGRDLPANIFNQWQGFAADAVEGSCSNFLSYMRDILCGGNENLFRYLEGWCARAVQRPWAQGEVAVVLRGNKGTGKSFFSKHFDALFGEHYVELTRFCTHKGIPLMVER